MTTDENIQQVIFEKQKERKKKNTNPQNSIHGILMESQTPVNRYLD